MAKKAAKFKPGQMVRVVDGETMPEFPDLSISGWTGMVLETRGRGDGLKYIIEWSDETVAQIPDDMRQQFEDQQLAVEMACLPAVVVIASE